MSGAGGAGCGGGGGGGAVVAGAVVGDGGVVGGCVVVRLGSVLLGGGTIPPGGRTVDAGGDVVEGGGTIAVEGTAARRMVPIVPTTAANAAARDRNARRLLASEVLDRCAIPISSVSRSSARQIVTTRDPGKPDSRACRAPAKIAWLRRLTDSCLAQRTSWPHRAGRTDCTDVRDEQPGSTSPVM